MKSIVKKCKWLFALAVLLPVALLYVAIRPSWAFSLVPAGLFNAAGQLFSHFGIILIINEETDGSIRQSVDLAASRVLVVRPTSAGSISIQDGGAAPVFNIVADGSTNIRCDAAPR
jgi:hypothetical protein